MSRFATLAHVMSNTAATAPSKMKSVSRTSLSPSSAEPLARSSRSGTTATPIFVFDCWIILLEALRDGAHLGLRLGQRHAGFEATHDPERMIVPLREQLRRERGRQVDFGFLARVVEGGWHDADHGALDAVENDVAPDDVGIGAEASHPESAAQDDDRRGARAFVVRGERAAENRRQPEDGEQIRRRADRADVLGLSAAREVVFLQAVVERHVLERAAALFPVDVGGRRDRAVTVEADRGRLFPEKHEPIGFRERQRPQQHGAHDAEDRGVRADAEREDQHGDDGEAGRAREHADGVANVLE